MRRSRWNLNSSAMSRSIRERTKTPLTSDRNRASISELLRPRRERATDRGSQPVPAFRLFAQPLTAGDGKRVILRAPVVVRRAPFGLQQTLVLQPVKRRIERPFFNRQRFPANLLNTEAHPINMYAADTS